MDLSKEMTPLKKIIWRKTELLRYTIVDLLTKVLTPSLYRKIDLIGLLGGETHNPIYSGVARCPRPAILKMKDVFKGKKVRGVEVGVFRGDNAKSILKELNIEKLFLVDSWGNYNQMKAKMEGVYLHVLDELGDNKKVEIIRKESRIGVNCFEDNSLDFVYVDANHTYESVYQDISLWVKKIKINGIMGGHDVFNWMDVLDAVKDFCVNHKIRFEIKLPDWYFIKKEVK